jgi:hypothetical protein
VGFLVRLSETPFPTWPTLVVSEWSSRAKEVPERDHPESQIELQDVLGAVRRGRVGGGVLGGVRLTGLIAACRRRPL